MAEKTIVERAGEAVGFGMAMAEDMAGIVKTAFGGAVTTLTDVWKTEPAKEAAPTTAVKAAPAKKAAKKALAKKAVKKAPAKRAPAKKSPAKKAAARKAPAKKAVAKKTPAKKVAKKSIKKAAKKAIGRHWTLKVRHKIFPHSPVST